MRTGQGDLAQWRHDLGFALAVTSCGMFLAVCLPVEVLAAEYTLTPSIEVSEEYASNIDLEPDGLEDSALVTRISPSAAFRARSARVDAALNTTTTIRHQTAGQDKGGNLDFDLSGTSDVEFVRNLLFLEADASISRQVLSSELANSEANQETVQSYRLSPVLKPRFGSFAAGEFRYELNQVFLSGEVSDDTTHAVSAGIDNGPDFHRFRWFVNGRVSESIRSEAANVRRGDVDLSGEYAVARWLHLLAGLGYQLFDDGTTTEFDSPKWHAGVRLRPGRRTELEATFRRSDDQMSPALQFSYDIGPRTKLTASYAEVLSTSQERLAKTLSAIAFDTETEDFVDERLERSFNPKTDPFDIDDTSARIRTFRVRLQGKLGRNDIGLSGSFAIEEKQPSGLEQDNLAIDVEWGRQLRRDLRLDAAVGYEHIEFADGQEDDEYLANARLSYKIRENAQAFVSYFFRTQDSSDATSEFTDHRFTVGVRIEF